ncbi:MAG: anhydro-N-acetylmuramic acid kinase [Pseudomonadota bacterium]
MFFNSTKKPIVALGLMSGTSKDGVDVVSLVTDGQNHIKKVQHFAKPYPRGLYARLKELATGDIPLIAVLQLEREVTQVYVLAVQESGFLDDKVAVIGCHGQTVRHLPHEGLTWQLGDPNYLAEKLSIGRKNPLPVVMDFRRRDLAAGGEGAPLVPLFHQAMLAAQGPAAFPCAVLNIGGVANVTYLPVAKGDVRASDCGPGMGLLDQWVQQRTGAAFDDNGSLAKAGTVDEAVLERAKRELPFFQRAIPRSADRYEFNAVLEWLHEASTENGAATLAALTVLGIDQTLHGFGAQPEALTALYLAGGGPRNAAVREGLAAKGWKLANIEEALGWHPLAVEAACFAWLAVRRLRGLPFSLPTTTGCRHPTVGGVVTFGA